MDVFPQLVRQETKLVDFLRTEHFDVKKASQRICNYWKFRKEIFEDRWLLPMTQSGNGALTLSEVEHLRCAYSVCFRRANQGMLVIHDHSRLKHFDGMVHAKLVMYLSTIMTDAPTQTEGATLVFVIKSGERPPEDFKRAAWGMISTALPIRVKQILVVQAYEEGREYLLQFLAYQTKRALEVKSNLLAEHLMGDSPGNLLSLLHQRGVSQQFLPTALGGGYQYDRFSDWVRMRLSIEDVMAAAPLKCNKLTPRLEVATATTTAAAPGALVVHNNTAAKKKRKRKKPTGPNDEGTKKLNALYARRSYHKRKLEVLGLEEQVEALRSHQKKLQSEGLQLQQGLAMAQQLLAGHGRQTPPPPPPATLPQGTTAMGAAVERPTTNPMNFEPLACPPPAMMMNIEPIPFSPDTATGVGNVY